MAKTLFLTSATLLLVLGMPGMIRADFIDTTANTGYQQLGGNGSEGAMGPGGQGGRGGDYSRHTGDQGHKGGKGGTGGTGGAATWNLGSVFVNNGAVQIGGSQGPEGATGATGYSGYKGGDGGYAYLPGLPGAGPVLTNVIDPKTGVSTFWVATGGVGGVVGFPPIDGSNPRAGTGGSGVDGSGAGGGGGAGFAEYLLYDLDEGGGGLGGAGAQGAGGSGAAGTTGATKSHTTLLDFVNSSAGVIQVGGSGGRGGPGGQGGQGGGGRGGTGSLGIAALGETGFAGGAGGDGGDGGAGGDGGQGNVLLWNGAEFINHSRVVIFEGSRLQSIPGATLVNNYVLHNEGSLINGGDVTNSGLLSNDGTLTNTGVLNNLNEIAGTGTYRQTAGRTFLRGSISQGMVDIQGGVLTGSGAITGPTTLGAGATLMPGDSPGHLDIVGDLLLDADSMTEIELGGLIPGTEYDYVNVSGTATLGGELSVSFWDWTDNGIDDPFAPQAGDVFDVFFAETLLGGFDQVTLGALGSGLHWEYDYLYDQIGATDVLRLSVVASEPIPVPAPTPGSVVLVVTGLVGLATHRRRPLAESKNDGSAS